LPIVNHTQGNADIYYADKACGKGVQMRRAVKDHKTGSIWTKDLIPEDSVWRRDLIPQGSMLRKDLLNIGTWKRARCLECPILMMPDERRCSKFHTIPDAIWEGTEDCPIYEDR